MSPPNFCDLWTAEYASGSWLPLPRESYPPSCVSPACHDGSDAAHASISQRRSTYSAPRLHLEFQRLSLKVIHVHIQYFLSQWTVRPDSLAATSSHFLSRASRHLSHNHRHVRQKSPPHASRQQTRPRCSCCSLLGVLTASGPNGVRGTLRCIGVELARLGAPPLLALRWKRTGKIRRTRWAKCADLGVSSSVAWT